MRATGRMGSYQDHNHHHHHHCIAVSFCGPMFDLCTTFNNRFHTTKPHQGTNTTLFPLPNRNIRRNWCVIPSDPPPNISPPKH